MHDGARHGGGTSARSAVGDRLPARRERGVDGVEQAAPTGRPRRRARRRARRRDRSRRVRRRGGWPSPAPRRAYDRTDDGRGCRTVVVEQRFQRRAVEERHHEQRGDLGRIADVLPHDVGHAARRCPATCAAPAPGGARRGSAPVRARGARPSRPHALSPTHRREREAGRTTGERRDVVARRSVPSRARAVRRGRALTQARA